jgi:hypothetical protein
MSTAASSVAPLVAALVDDAAVFPPGNAPMPDAVRAHRRHREAPYARLVGRFLCPASRLGELRDRLVDGDALRLGLIVDTGLAGLAPAVAEVRAETRLVLEAVEIPLRVEGGGTLAGCAREVLAALPGCLAYVEIPRVAGWQDALDVVTSYQRGAKLRTGGTSAEMFPSVAEVAAFVTACVERATPFKCTAGLHNAVRHRDPRTGFEHHGFLNILLATHAALTGGDAAAVLDERSGEVLAEAARRIAPADAYRARALFAGYGSCDIAEPVADLTALGLLP